MDAGRALDMGLGAVIGIVLYGIWICWLLDTRRGKR
jgi:hypothetical protein